MENVQLLLKSIFDDFKSSYIETLNEDFKKELKEKIFEIKNYQFSKDTFQIMNITAEKAKEGLYKTTNLDFTLNKPILFIEGINSTGKTTTFDKIAHFFLFYDKMKSPFRGETTDLSIILRDNSGFEYSILFNSNKKEIENRFEVNKKKVGSMVYTKINNPLNFLISKRILNNPLNCFHFIREIKGDSFFKDYCSTKEKFIELIRFKPINQLFQLLKEKLKKFDELKKEISNEITAFTDEESTKKMDIKEIRNSLSRREFRVKNEKMLIEARKEFDTIDSEIEKQKIELSKKIHNIQSEIKVKNKELDQLTNLVDRGVESKIELYVQKNTFFCGTCGKPIMKKTILERILIDRCYNCGFFDYDYKDKLDLIEVPEFSNLKDKKDILIKEIAKLYSELNSLYSQSKTVLSSSSKYSSEILKEIFIYSSVSELSSIIEDSKKDIEVFNSKIKILTDQKNEVLEKVKICKEKIIPIEEQIKLITNIIDDLHKKEEIITEKFITQFLLHVNQFLVNLFQDETVGKVKYDKRSGKLMLSITYNSEIDPIQKETQNYPCYEEKSSISQGLDRKIDFAWSSAFINLNDTTQFSPFKTFLLIDGLETFSKIELDMIFKSISSSKDRKYLIFLNEIPEIDSSLYDIKHLTKNERITTDDVLNLKVQSDLRFF